MRRLKKNVATAMIAAMSLTMLPAQLWGTTVDAATTKKVAAKKIEITVSNNKGLKSALKKSNVNKIILNTASAKNFRVPKGNYKDKILVINSSDKSKVYISKGAKFKKIIYLGTVKNASLVIDEAGNKIELASKITLNISGKAAYADIVYKAGAEEAKVSSKIELIVQNKAKKTVKLTVAGKKVSVKSGDSYANSDLDVTEDDTAQGKAVIKEEDSNQANTRTNENKSSSTDTVNSGSTGSTGGGYIGGGYSGGGSTLGNSSTSVTPAKENVKLINVDKTKVVSPAIFLRYVVVSFENGYNPEKASVYVDGVDITSELTKVDTEGTIYKWYVYGKYPSEVKVESKVDKTISQSVKLEVPEGAKVISPVVSKDSANKVPEYFIGRGSISRFDYYLDNYDNEGNRRMFPSVKTFSSKFSEVEKFNEKPYYAPTVKLGQDLVVMFNYDTDEEKKWFDGIETTGALQLVEDDASQMTLKKDVNYKKEFKDHYGKKKGILVIKTGNNERNFRTAGYFRLRVRSKGDKAYMLRIRLEEPGQPKFSLNEVKLQSGKNIHFKVSGVRQGAKRAVEKAELTTPDGKTKTLRYITDYFFYGDLFTLFNDVEAKDGVNNTEQTGHYKLKVYFNEYEPGEAEFDIEDGKTVNKVTSMGTKAGLISLDGMKFDAIASATSRARATGSGRGSSSGDNSVGSLTITRDLIFDTEMLANASIIDALKIKNDYATAIVKRFESDVTPVAVYNHNSDFYDYAKYSTVMAKIREDGRFLTFDEYMKLPESKEAVVKKITNANAVLEDDLIGGVLDGNHFGEKPVELVVENGGRVDLNGEIKIKGDPEYLKKINYIFPRKVLQEGYIYKMRKDNEYKVEGDTLTIKGLGLVNRHFPNTGTFPRKVSVLISAEGYQYKEIELTVVKDEGKKEEGLRSLTMPENGKFTTRVNKGVLTFGPNVGVKTSAGTVKEWMMAISSISIDGVAYKTSPKGTFRPNTGEYMVTTVVEIKLPESKKNNIPMIIEAKGYKTYKFTIDASGDEAKIIKGEEVGGSTEPANPSTSVEETFDLDAIAKTETANDVPDAKSLTMPAKDKKLFVSTDNGKISIGTAFTGNGEEVLTWLKSVNSVKVGNVEYTKIDKGEVKDNQFKFESQWNKLEIKRPTTKSTALPLVIKAERYKTYVFAFDNSSDDKVVDTFRLVEVPTESKPNEDTNPAENPTAPVEPAKPGTSETQVPSQPGSPKPGTGEPDNSGNAGGSNSGAEGQKTTQPADKQQDDGLLKLDLPQTFKITAYEDTKFTIDKGFLGSANSLATKTWLEKVNKVIVKNVQYKEVTLGITGSLKENEYAKTKDISDNTKLEIARPKGLSAEENSKVSLEIQAEGYKTYIFTFDNSQPAVAVTEGKEKKVISETNQDDKNLSGQANSSSANNDREKEDLKAENEKLSSEKKVLEIEINKLKAENEILKADKVKLGAEKTTLESEKLQLETAKGKTEANNKELTAENENLKTEKEGLKTVNSQLEQRIKELEDEIKKLRGSSKLKSLNLSKNQIFALKDFTEYTFFIKSTSFIKDKDSNLISDWIKNIEYIKFDNEGYHESKNNNKVDINEYKKFHDKGEIKIRRPQKKDGGLTLTIKSKGFKTYEFIFDNSAKSNQRITFVREIED